MCRLRALPALLLVFLCPGSLAAQSGGGTVQGAVSDSGGLAVPGAKVSIVHLTANRATQTESNESGLSVNPPLKGMYCIRVSHSGMTT